MPVMNRMNIRVSNERNIHAVPVNDSIFLRNCLSIYFIILLMVSLFFGRGNVYAEDAVEEIDGLVIAGSVDNSMTISVYNPSTDASIEEVNLEVAEQAQWITNVRIAADASGPLAPNKTRRYTVTFDISADAVKGSVDSMTFQVSAKGALIDQPNPGVSVYITDRGPIQVCVLNEDAPEKFEFENIENAVDYCDFERTPSEYDRIAVFFTPQQDLREPLEERGPFRWQIVGPNGMGIKSGAFGSRLGEASLSVARKDSPGRFVTIVDLWDRSDDPDPARARSGPGTYKVQSVRGEYTSSSTFGQGDTIVSKAEKGRLEDGSIAYEEWLDEGTFEITSSRLYFQGFVTENVKNAPFPNRVDLWEGELTLEDPVINKSAVTVNAEAWWREAKKNREGEKSPEDKIHRSKSRLTIDFPEQLIPGYEEMGEIKASITPLEFGKFFFTAGMHLMIPTDQKTPARTLVEGNKMLVPWADHIGEKNDKWCGKPEGTDHIEHRGNTAGSWFWPADAFMTDGCNTKEPVNQEDRMMLIAGKKELRAGQPERSMPAHLHDQNTSWVIPVFITLTDLDARLNHRLFEMKSYGYAIYANHPGRYTGPRPAGGPETGRRPAGGERIAGTGEGESADIDRETAETETTDTPSGDDVIADVTPSETEDTTERDSDGVTPTPPGRVVDNREVPKVEGLSALDAQTRLAGAGFEMTPVPGPPAPDKDQSGTVESQNPAPHTHMETGGTVKVTIYSDYVDIREVPNVEGLSAGEAKTKLTEAGFVIKPLPGSPAASKDKSGTVESQNPSARTKMEAGSIVEVRIHTEYIDTREVPDVVGLSARDAQEKIAAAGLLMKPKPGKSASTEKDVGRVSTQSPNPGSTMEKGSPITVTVYGPVEESIPDQRFKTIVVPDVKGLTAGQAKQRITDAGLKPVFRPGGTPGTQDMEGMVERQSPASGTNTGSGAEVDIYVYGTYVSETLPEDYCSCEIDTSLMDGESDFCGLYIENKNQYGEYDPHGRDRTYHIVNNALERSSSWKKPDGWDHSDFNTCGYFLDRISCEDSCPEDEGDGSKLTAKTIVGYWNVTGEESEYNATVYGYIEFFQDGRFHSKVTNKQADGEVEEQEGNGSWELVGDQLTFSVDGGITRKGTVDGDPSVFTMHDTAGWTLRFKK